MSLFASPLVALSALWAAAPASPVPLFPEAASTYAPKVDALYFFLVGVAGFFSLLIFFLVLFFAVRYRRRSENERPVQIHGNTRLEIVWAGIPLILSMVMFFWGARLYVEGNRPPQNAMDIWVVGKQWMWHIQHPEGRKEINELHVPVGRPVRLRMTSQDVIHSFFIPAFRVKQDVIPGRYSNLWFEPTKPGRYHLFCAEYCGTKHSTMIGSVVVMEPSDYQAWLSGGVQGESLEVAGERLFQGYGCATCHRQDNPDARGPSLAGLFGNQVKLATGAAVEADEAYLRESIVNPASKVVAGYQPIMPVFLGQIPEEGLIQILAYLKSIGKKP